MFMCVSKREERRSPDGQSTSQPGKVGCVYKGHCSVADPKTFILHA